MLCKKLLEQDVMARSEVNNHSNNLKITFIELAALKEEKDSLQKNLEQSEKKFVAKLATKIKSVAKLA